MNPVKVWLYAKFSENLAENQY